MFNIKINLFLFYFDQDSSILYIPSTWSDSIEVSLGRAYEVEGWENSLGLIPFSSHLA